jgi:tight adherence protein C
MTLLVALCGATGIVLAITGLPPLNKATLSRRVDPYLSGLHGRPSRLLQPPMSSGRIGRWARTLVGGMPLSGARELADRLDAAGYEGGPESFRVEQATWGAVGGIGCAFALLGLAGTGLQVDVRAVPLLTVAGAVAGWLARDWWLSKQSDARLAAITEELPAAIDLVTLSIMAGESVAAACARSAPAVGGDIGAELHRMVAEVRAGAPVVEALEAMSRRVPDPSMARFVDALCTAIEKGAPLADVLRAQADDCREARRRHLLELGGRREVLMLVPVVFLIMPVVIVFALYPGLVSLDLLVP